MVNASERPAAPKYYTDFEGGSWLPWKHGDVHDDQLRTIGFKMPGRISVNGIMIHSFLFGDIPTSHTEPQTILRWDCMNGWDELRWKAYRPNFVGKPQP